MRPVIPALLFMLAGGLPAMASGGIACDAKDDQAAIAISSAVTRGMGSPLFNFTGSLKTHLNGIGEDLRSLSYEKDNVVQWWLDGEQLNLLLYVERQDEPFGSTELSITTRAVDEGAYEGEYAVVSYDADVRAEVTGKISCMAE